MLKQIAFLILINFAALTASATELPLEVVLETCKIESSLTLAAPTQIFCENDLEITDGVEIITQGHGLQIVSLGSVEFGTENGLGLNITAQAEVAGRVSVYVTRTASGHLNIDNKATVFGGDVELEYGSRFRYAQTIDAGNAAAVRTVVSGQDLPL